MANENDDIKGLVILVAAVVAVIVAYFILEALMFLAVLLVAALVIAAVAGATFAGFWLAHKTAVNENLWDNRRIAKHKRHQRLREQEKEHFKQQGQLWLCDVVDSHYDDEDRDLYEKKDYLGAAVRTASQIKEIFKK